VTAKHRGPVVVGIDVMNNNGPVLKWAVREADARHLALRVVHAYGPVVANPWAPATYERNEIEVLRRASEDVVAKTLGQVRILSPDLSAIGAAVEGDARQVLIAESATAPITVLGSRHLASMGATLLGSVGCGVSAGARGPIVVVRGPSGDPEEGAGVVVGIDGSEPAEDVLEFAFNFASTHAAPLRAVMCWRPDPLAAIRWRPEQPVPPRAELWLAETIAGWQEKFPDVEVHSAVIRDHPVSGLVAESMAQRLLVVGNRGRHPLADTLLGSIAQGVLHHATCPVAVIPTR
jgi:nucleotide-binding universal stress UspA family protein